MASDIANLLARRSAIIAELAGITGNGLGGPAGRVNSDVDGQSFDFAKYKQGLLDELKTINGTIASIEGPWEVTTQGVP